MISDCSEHSKHTEQKHQFSIHKPEFHSDFVRYPVVANTNPWFCHISADSGTKHDGCQSNCILHTHFTRATGWLSEFLIFALWLNVRIWVQKVGFGTTAVKIANVIAPKSYITGLEVSLPRFPHPQTAPVSLKWTPTTINPLALERDLTSKLYYLNKMNTQRTMALWQTLMTTAATVRDLKTSRIMATTSGQILDPPIIIVGPMMLQTCEHLDDLL